MTPPMQIADPTSFWAGSASPITKATPMIKKTNAITQSVANTAKRVIVIIGVALVMGEALPAQKLVGSAICIGGVMLYSIIDDLMKK